LPHSLADLLINIGAIFSAPYFHQQAFYYRFQGCQAALNLTVTTNQVRKVSCGVTFHTQRFEIFWCQILKGDIRGFLACFIFICLSVQDLTNHDGATTTTGTAIFISRFEAGFFIYAPRLLR
jgi:hypothetical protein